MTEKREDYAYKYLFFIKYRGILCIVSKRLHSASSNSKQQQVLDNVEKAVGGIPNLLATMAQSPAVANAYLAFYRELSLGSLGTKLRESLALTVGEENSCEYCISAHSTLGRNVGLSDEEIMQARKANATDPKIHVALRFAQRLVVGRGIVTDSDIHQLRDHDYSDGDISEIVANVALNIFTNYFNHVAGTEVDFPMAPKLK